MKIYVDIMFPVKSFSDFSKDNTRLVYSIAVLYVVLSVGMSGTTEFPKNFYSPSDHFLWDVYFSVQRFLYSVPGKFVFFIVSSLAFHWALYALLGINKSRISFWAFLAPFLTIVFVLIPIHLIRYFAGQMYQIPFWVGAVTSIYMIIFVFQILKHNYAVSSIKIIRCLVIALCFYSIVSFVPTAGAGFLLQKYLPWKYGNTLIGK